MRISDWSSDVCSSDLIAVTASETGFYNQIEPNPVQGLPANGVVEPAERDCRLIRLPLEIRGERALLDRSRKAVPLGPSRHRPCLLPAHDGGVAQDRSEEHTSEIQSLMRTSYAVLRFKKKK